MQQIKIKCRGKKKNLTIESIRVELFEKSNYPASRRYHTLEHGEKDIFSPSRRYLHSISPHKLEHHPGRPPPSLPDDNLNWGMRRYAQMEGVGLSCLKKRVVLAREINQLKLAIRRSTACKIEQSQKLVRRVQERQVRALTPIPNEPQVHKSFSENVKRVKTKPDIFVSDGNCLALSKDCYENSMLLKPLNVSINLPDSNRRKKQERIKQLEHALLSFNREGSKVEGRCRETLVSPWRTAGSEEENFGGF